MAIPIYHSYSHYHGYTDLLWLFIFIMAILIYHGYSHLSWLFTFNMAIFIYYGYSNASQLFPFNKAIIYSYCSYLLWLFPFCMAIPMHYICSHLSWLSNLYHIYWVQTRCRWQKHSEIYSISYHISPAGDLEGQVADLQEASESAVSKLGEAEKELEQLREENKRLKTVAEDGSRDLGEQNKQLKEQVAIFNKICLIGYDMLWLWVVQCRLLCNLLLTSMKHSLDFTMGVNEGKVRAIINFFFSSSFFPFIMAIPLISL